MPFLLAVGCGAGFHQLCLHSGGVRRPLLWILAPLAAAAAASGCGGSGGEDRPPPQPEPTAQPADFPAASGKSLNDLASMADGEGPVLAPSVSLLHKGPNRFGFALYDTAKKQITGVQVALYTSDPDAAKSVYVADVPFKRNGKQAVIAMAKFDGRLLRSNPYGVNVTRPGSGPPEVGARAVDVHTQTITDVGGDAAQLDTRRPVAKDLLQDDLADALAKRPVVITFATPLLCQSRVCGPVVDIVEQVKATAPKGVAFIHQEIYAGNDVNKGLRPQVTQWRLRSEPWTFVIDRRGRISARFEGAFSPGELQRAVAKVSSGT
jgi:hypothetical protein